MTSVDVDMELNIDNTNWTPVYLGDVVEESREVIRDPVKEGVEKVVGLEHIDSESIHLRRWETLEQSTTFTKKFVKGQVLFGRRRAYLKKAALAPFDGICSGDITVLEAKENLLPELLPFLINNDKFFDFAIKNSAGSLSPRAKFKDIANYEFLLPPKDQQVRLAELLWAADEVIQSYGRLLISYEENLEANLNSLIFGESGYSQMKKTQIGEIPVEWGLKKLEELCLKIGDGIHKTPEYVDDSEYLFVNGNNLINNQITKTGVTKCVPYSEFLKYNKRLNKQTILLSINGTIGNVAIYKGEEVVFGKSIAFMSVKEDELDPLFLFYLLQTRKIRTFFEMELTGSTISNLSLKTVRSTPIPLPSVLIQKDISARIRQLFDCKNEIIQVIATSKQLQKSLINQIF